MPKEPEQPPVEKVTATEVRSTLVFSILEQVRRDHERVQQIIAPAMEKMAPFIKVAAEINRQMAVSGVFKQVQMVQETFNKILMPSLALREYLVPQPLPPLHQAIEVPSPVIERVTEKAATRLTDSVASGRHFNYSLILTSGGDMFRESNPMLRYPLAGSRLRMRILRALLVRRGWYPSSELAEDVGMTVDALYDAVSALNRNARSRLELPLRTPNNLIVGHKGTGYQVNVLYLITERT